MTLSGWPSILSAKFLMANKGPISKQGRLAPWNCHLFPCRLLAGAGGTGQTTADTHVSAMSTTALPGLRPCPTTGKLHSWTLVQPLSAPEPRPVLCPYSVSHCATKRPSYASGFYCPF